MSLTKTRGPLKAAEPNVPPIRLQNGTAMRAEWSDPDDTNTRAKSARRVLGVRAYDPLLQLKAAGTLTDAHMRCAERLRDDRDLSHGAKPGYERPEVSGSGQAFPAETQLAALERMRGAMLALGMRMSAPVVAIVLEHQSVSQYAERVGSSRHYVVGYFAACMDKLVDFYEPAVSRK